MSTFKLEIATDNAAFCDPNGNPAQDYKELEVARLLSRAAEKIQEHGITEGSLFDGNGARVGTFYYEED